MVFAKIVRQWLCLGAIGLWLWGVACQPESRWSSPSEPTRQCDPALVLPQDARWKASFGSAVGRALGCLHLQRFEGTQSKVSVLPVSISKDGTVFAYSNDSQQYNQIPSLNIPPEERQWSRRYRIYVLQPSSPSYPQHRELCQKMATSQYDCFQDPDRCWFYFAFAPESPQFSKEKISFPERSTGWCQLVTEASLDLPEKGVSSTEGEEEIVDSEKISPEDAGVPELPKENPPEIVPRIDYALCGLAPRNDCNCPPDQTIAKLNPAHDQDVKTVLYSPDGAYFVTSGGDGRTKLWNAKTMKELWNVARIGQSGFVRNVSFHPGGEFVALGDDIGRVRLLKLSDGQSYRGNIFTLPSARWMRIHPTETQMLLLHVAGRPVQIWDLQKDVPFSTEWSAGSRSPQAVELSADGKLLALWEGTQIAVWEWSSKKLVQQVSADGLSNVGAGGMAFRPGASVLVVHNGKNTLRIWDFSKPNGTLQSFQTSTDVSGPVQFRPQGDWLAVPLNSGEIDLWDLSAPTPSKIRTLGKHPKGVNILAWHSEGLEFATAAQEREVWRWRCGNCIPSHQLHLELTGHQAPVTALAFSPKTWNLFSSSTEKSLVQTSPYHGGNIQNASVSLNTEVHQLLFSMDGERLFAAQKNQAISMMEERINFGVSRTLTGHSAAVRGLAISATGTLLVSASEDSRLRFWNLSSNPPQGSNSPRLQGEGQTSLVLLQDKWVVATTTTGELLVWEQENRTSLQEKRHEATALRVVAVPEPGQDSSFWLVSGGSDQRLIFWRFSLPAKLEVLWVSAPLGAEIQALVWEPNGRWLWAGTSQGKVSAWKPQKQPLGPWELGKIYEFEAHQKAILDLALHPGGRLFATSSADSSVKVWGCP